MKPNNPHHWIIDLHGVKPKRVDFHTAKFVGTVDAALSEADELESEVSFDVTQIVLTRGKRARRNPAA